MQYLCNTSQESDFSLSLCQGYYGGPLVNMDGEVVGVISMHYENAYGIALVVPSDSDLQNHWEIWVMYVSNQEGVKKITTI